MKIIWREERNLCGRGGRERQGDIFREEKIKDPKGKKSFEGSNDKRTPLGEVIS